MEKSLAKEASKKSEPKVNSGSDFVYDNGGFLLRNYVLFLKKCLTLWKWLCIIGDKSTNCESAYKII